MAINPNINTSLFIVSPELQEPMIDKDTGTVMAGGIVKFFQDNERTELKNVFVQTGAPGSYTYAALPNPMVLTAAGTPADAGGNDAIIYWYPFDENDPDIAQPYYVTVVNANLVPQFTRSNWPYINASEEPNNNSQLIPNFIANGQFLAHNNLVNNLYPNGNIVAVSTISGTPTNVGGIVIAPGGSGGPGNVAGWQFQKPTDNNDTDSIQFVTEVTASGSTLSGNPVYALELTCSNIGATHDGPKQLVYPFYNVNLFSSGTQFYTFAFQGQSLNTAPLAVTFEIYQYFGPSGTAPVTTVVPGGNFEFGFGTWNWQQVSFLFPSTAGMTIDNSDPNNPPYVALVVKFPNGTGQVYSVLLDNFVLTPGVLQISSYPEVPANDNVATGIAGALPIPKADGSDLYLPIIYTATGFNYDTTSIGDIKASISATIPASWKLANGAQLLTSGTDSTDGIPYSRLQKVLWNAGGYGNVPLFGTGLNFVTSYISSAATGKFYIAQNSSSTNTVPTDGNTTFTFATQWASFNTNNDFLPTRSTANSMLIKVLTAGQITGSGSVAAGTSGFGAATAVDVITTSTTGAATVNAVISITGIVSAASLANPSGAGKYFKIANTTTTFYVWYQLTNETDPAPAGVTTGIKVLMQASDTAADITYKTIQAINGGYLSLITPLDGAAVVNNSYFTFTSNSQAYYVWYNKGTPITDPAPGGIGIPVALTGSETAIQVATKTQQAINQAYYALPDLRGVFLRGTDPTAIWDYNESNRGSLYNPTYFGAGPGTFEYDAYQNHRHTVTGNSSPASTAPFITVTNNMGTGSATDYAGGLETRPVNVSVNWLIRY